MLTQDRALEPFYEAVGPRMAWLGAGVPNSEERQALQTLDAAKVLDCELIAVE